MRAGRTGRRPAESRAGRQVYPWLVVGLLWFCGFFNYADRQAVNSVFPLLEKEFGLSDDPARHARLGIHGRLRLDLAVRRLRGRSGVPADLDSRWAWRLEPDLPRRPGSRGRSASSCSSGPPRGWASRSTSRRRCRSWPTITARATRSRAMGIHQTSVYLGTAGRGRAGRLAGRAVRLAIAVPRAWAWSGTAYAAVLGFVLVEPVRGQSEDGQAGRRDPIAELRPRGRPALEDELWTRWSGS